MWHAFPCHIPSLLNSLPVENLQGPAKIPPVSWNLRRGKGNFPFTFWRFSNLSLWKKLTIDRLTGEKAYKCIMCPCAQEPHKLWLRGGPADWRFYTPQKKIGAGGFWRVVVMRCGRQRGRNALWTKAALSAYNAEKVSQAAAVRGIHW